MAPSASGFGPVLRQAPIGLVGYLGFVAAGTGSWTGWQDIELRGWNTRFDWGREAIEWIPRTLLRPDGAFPTLIALLVIAAVVLAVVSIRRLS
ncbi:hypothetical protein [Amycolatopsis jiangsuensis]|uniref:Uncharacterized protein n=1 Tax=Amycolatopsis jiangsuensis TaxID=1181879 RepID=A0A840J0J3_9PSEU|nr:hypothetical protein [Amycolatopsis jiangsuensis]MBB4688631.1 hypothetical protein [Amycolatopsis jiangsuensis]